MPWLIAVLLKWLHLLTTVWSTESTAVQSHDVWESLMSCPVLFNTLNTLNGNDIRFNICKICCHHCFHIIKGWQGLSCYVFMISFIVFPSEKFKNVPMHSFKWFANNNLHQLCKYKDKSNQKFMLCCSLRFVFAASKWTKKKTKEPKQVWLMWVCIISPAIFTKACWSTEFKEIKLRVWCWD